MRVHDIPVAAAPWDPFAEGGRSGSVQNFSYSQMQGFRQEDGLLLPRETIQDLVTIGIENINPLGVGVAVGPEVDGTIQPHIPRVVMDLSAGGFHNEMAIVTNRDLFYKRDDIWVLLTPRYATGSVTVTLGSTTVTGSGTEWQTRGISPDSRINVPNDLGGTQLHRIAEIIDDTTMELVQPFQGDAGAGRSYIIYRNWASAANDLETPFFAKLHNGDLYVAGPLVMHPTFGPTGAVFRVANVGFGTVARNFDPDDVGEITTNYMTAGAVEAVPGLDFLDEWIQIAGMEVLADGQVILLTKFREPNETGNPTMPNSAGTARLFYSGLDQTVWTAPPGGFFDIVNHEHPATAIGKIGDAYTFHFLDGVDLGYVTGIPDPPLQPQRTSASHGTISPMALKQIRGTEFYPAVDGTVRVFDGQRSQVFAPMLRDELGQYSGELLQRAVGAYDGMRNRYRVFIPDRIFDEIEGSLSDPLYTMMVDIDVETGLASRSGFPAVITAAEDLPVQANAPFGWVRALGSTFIGIWNAPYSQPGFRNFLVALAEGFPEDDPLFIVPGGAPDLAGRMLVETNDIDFGEPGIAHYVDHVTVWLTKDRARLRVEEWLRDNEGIIPPIEQKFAVELVYGSTFQVPSNERYVASKIVRFDSVSDTTVVGHFFFPQASGERVRLRLRPYEGENPVEGASRMICSIARLQIHEQPLAPIEALTPGVIDTAVAEAV